MFTDLLTWEYMMALLSLCALEIVLGIDNLVFIAILTSKVEAAKQNVVRRVGLAMAMVQRLFLLFFLSHVMKLTAPLFSLFEHGFSGRDLILIFGGFFLIGKATVEIHATIEGDGEHHTKTSVKASVASILIQITLIDAIFSLDSVITAVGMVDQISIMIAAVVISVIVMMIFANPISNFIIAHPTIKMLALSFLCLIGTVLIADGFGKHVEKGYIYTAISFSMFVEFLNYTFRKKRAAKQSAAV